MPASLPTKAQLLAFIRENPTQVTRREIARAFNIKGDDRIALKRMLRELQDEGEIEKSGGRRLGLPESLPPVGVIEICGVDPDGEVLARPLDAKLDGPPPRIVMLPERTGSPALGVGDRVLARLSKSEQDGVYEAKTIRKLERRGASLVGVFKREGTGGTITSIDKSDRDSFAVKPADIGEAEDGELVLAEALPSRRIHGKQARVVRVLGDTETAANPSLIAIHVHGLQSVFPEAALAETEGATVPKLGRREDLRDYPLVTIDGADARDFDDAVFAEPDETIPGGFHLIVAIADVAHYVRPNSALDKTARHRGNSTYFPDRVVPMLPEKLSNDLCSLRPNVNRACMAFHMWIDAKGQMIRHRLVRGLMKSAARLTYEQVQDARNGAPDDTTGPLVETVITPLYAAYEKLIEARKERGTLELDLPEKQVIIDDNGRVTDIRNRVRLDSHKLIEEFMICANVAAAEALEAAKHPCVYRIHDEPDPEKLAAVRDYVRTIGLNLAKGQVIQPIHLTRLLIDAEKQGMAHLVSEVVLRAQSQAVYSPDNIGHFGLALRRYAHFTSPIRRYADLLIHRALIRAYKLGDDGMDPVTIAELPETCEAISACERRSISAERDATDRFVAQFLSSRIGEILPGKISGVTRFGLFVTLKESGGDGLVPMRALPDDYYSHVEQEHALIGERWGRVFRMGAEVMVKLVEADPLTGSTLLEIVEDKDSDIERVEPKPGTRPRGKPHKNKPFKRNGKKPAKPRAKGKFKS